MGSHASFEQPLQPHAAVHRSWHRDGFLLTTDKSFLDSAVVNDAFESDLMCIYAVPDTADDMKRNGGLPRTTNGPDFRMVGLARIVTDYVTFAYLTDVFVLEDFQRKGLASWMMRALKELIDEWPNLRGLILMTHDKAAARMYQRELGAVEFDQGPSAGLVLLEMGGRAQKDVPPDH
ncbi:hypothetical protein G6O67_008313 [Ophiocordyceps sinensis]|uniref:N-acetyltransferase domain-containing protein n=1 Tax=Ophiocordyceps sinensis TaxID=72228 RepID=A0A8H4PL63_9HYPO|nr:hypothetical protein G6O67_008313 [Ophiocordyceps sinensis]